jgi:guanylate kinase
VIARRLATAEIELAAQSEFDEVVVNDEIEAVCDRLVSLMGLGVA